MKRLVLTLGFTPLLISGCGFALSKGPPTGHEQMTAFSCTESNTGPALDLVWGGLNVLGALTAASDPNAYENSDQIVTVGLAWGVFSSFSAASGFSKSKQCRQALQQLAQRNGGAPAPGVVAPAPFGPVVVQVVVIAPGADTLAVGETVQLVATARGSSGAEILNRVFAWSSSNDAIASVSNAGLVTAHAPGAVVIAANTGNVVATATILVAAPK